MSKDFFWPAKTIKNLKFLRRPHVLELVRKCCSDINKGRCLKLFFYPLLLVNVSALFIELAFPSFGHVIGSTFVDFQCYGNVSNWIPKVV